MPDRAQRAFWALLVRSREIQSGIVYLGNVGLGERVDRCGRTIQRAKPQLRASGLVIVHAGGGKMINEHGQVTEAATGYELADVLFDAKQPVTHPAEPESAPRRESSKDAQKFRELAARFGSRAGP